MREYELFYLVGESKETELTAIRTEVETMVKEEGGEFLAPETQDKRKLAYEVKGETRGIYIARRFSLPDRGELGVAEFEKALADGDPITRLHRKIGLSKNILRALILRASELPELKPIERTEYVRKDGKSRSNYRPRPTTEEAMIPTPAAVPETGKQASSAEIDAQLKEKLDI